MAKAVTIATDKSGKLSIIESEASPSEQVKKLSQYRQKGLPKGVEVVQVISLATPLKRLSKSKIEAQKKHDKEVAEMQAEK